MMSDQTRQQFWLASASPRRRELLRQVGFRFDVMQVEIDETPGPSESPLAYVRRLAGEKARAGYRLASLDDGLPVLGADTTVVSGGHILGKPDNWEQFSEMFRRLSGTMHDVLTGVAICQQDRVAIAHSATRVRFRTVSAAEQQRYWETEEPLGKAGGYAIQGLGAVFVEHIEGSYSGVVGLPLYETTKLLADYDIHPWQGPA